MSHVTLSPMAVQRAIAFGQLEHIDQRLISLATRAFALQKQLAEIHREIRNDVIYRERQRQIIESCEQE